VARPRSGDKQKAILDAALRICAERGIGGAPTSAISKAAGIAEGSLFTYFKTKDELLDEARAAGIHVTSHMTKADLGKALQKANERATRSART